MKPALLAFKKYTKALKILEYKSVVLVNQSDILNADLWGSSRGPSPNLPLPITLVQLSSTK